MNFLRFLISVFLFTTAVTLSSSAPEIIFNRTEGMNMTNTSDIFFYRNATISTVSYKTPVNGVFATNNKWTEPYNIVGSGVVAGDISFNQYSFTVPPSILGFYSFGQKTIEPDELARMIYYGTKNNVTMSFLTLMLMGIAEYKNDGSIVDFIPFNVTASPGKPGWSEFVKLSETNEGVSAYTTTYKSPGHIEFRLTVIGSDYAGVLTYGWVPVSPSSTSYVLEINNYPYKSTETHLGLVFSTSLRRNQGVFGRNMTVRVYDYDKVLSYVSFPEYVWADGNLVQADVSPPQSKFSKVSMPTDMSDLMSLFLYQENGLVRYHVVHFPKTALDIVYGISVGGGDPIHRHVKFPVQKQSSSASGLLLSFCSLALAALLLF